MHVHTFVNVLLLFMISCLQISQALPHKKITGTKPRYLVDSKRSDMALPLDYGSPSDSNTLGSLVQAASPVQKVMEQDCDDSMDSTDSNPAQNSHMANLE